MSTPVLDERRLREGFENCTLGDGQFPHREHVRLTLAYLREYGEVEALRRLVEGLQRFAAYKGHPEKFHYTITKAWVRLIESARRNHPSARSFEELTAECPELLDSGTARRFYSDELLNSETARQQWVEPDRDG